MQVFRARERERGSAADAAADRANGLQGCRVTIYRACTVSSATAAPFSVEKGRGLSGVMGEESRNVLIVCPVTATRLGHVGGTTVSGPAKPFWTGMHLKAEKGTCNRDDAHCLGEVV